MSSPAERAAAARATRIPTPEDVMFLAAFDFPDEDVATVLAILDEYDEEATELGRARVQRAILVLAEGNIEKLRSYTQDAIRDYRDVLSWAEYPSSG